MNIAFLTPKRAVKYLLEKGKYQGKGIWIIANQFCKYRPGSCVIRLLAICRSCLRRICKSF